MDAHFFIHQKEKDKPVYTNTRDVRFNCGTWPTQVIKTRSPVGFDRWSKPHPYHEINQNGRRRGEASKQNSRANPQPSINMLRPYRWFDRLDLLKGKKIKLVFANTRDVRLKYATWPAQVIKTRSPVGFDRWSKPHPYNEPYQASQA